MALPTGQISLSQVNVELGLTSTATISLDQANVRSLAGVSSGAISMQNLQGKSSEFAFTIASNQTNANLATLATNAGWNQTARLVATINSGIFISSNSTGTPALAVNGSFPNGVELVNNGFIVGMGGNGGAGAQGMTANSAGVAGASGVTGLAASVPVSVRNNGTIAGGGGGGGGGGQVFELPVTDPKTGTTSGGYGWGGGGGGGGQTGTTNSSGGAAGDSFGQRSRVGTAGGAGTISAGGAGGVSHAAPNFSYRGGDGGAGGSWGASGATGQTGFGPGYPVTAGGAGAAAGNAISGNANITYLATGTRLGAIT